ncbi:hypothetical protein EGR_08346 [Echinococcus granulosus]|uniref:Uncharacterized protein n=1 Tax=Echinococcus granulosus TaxID=6210 RepID=W6U6B6_ECHGR|nr:hypothetical protein EGR_08346 [Echinococcus granulosus]EUB56768.1 hypothetical protein EGR_08346 [Echinococcus granulosus]
MERVPIWLKSSGFSCVISQSFNEKEVLSFPDNTTKRNTALSLKLENSMNRIVNSLLWKWSTWDVVKRSAAARLLEEEKRSWERVATVIASGSEALGIFKLINFLEQLKRYSFVGKLFRSFNDLLLWDMQHIFP